MIEDLALTMFMNVYPNSSMRLLLLVIPRANCISKYCFTDKLLVSLDLKVTYTD
jgi:hypothetical protein